MLEDLRLSRMYAALTARKIGEWRRSLWRIAMIRSGLLTMVLVTLTIVGLAFGWREHRLGKFSRLKHRLNRGATPVSPVNARPGGQDAIVLQRTRLEGQTVPEFLSATVLPGLGMNVLQITAYLPHKGEVSLLASPTLDEAARLPEGNLSGGAFEVPWSSHIFGTASADGKSLTMGWGERKITLPAVRAPHSGDAVAQDGLLLGSGAATANTNVMPDGGETQATFEAGNFRGHWISRTEITTSIQLSSRALELKMVARNTGDQPEPIGMGWHPRFAVLSGDRRQATLRMPNAMRAEVTNQKQGRPSGKLLPVAGTEYDFTERNGRQLGELNLDDSFVHLRPALFDNGPIAELRDPASNYGLRITAITPTIKTMRVEAPANENFVSIEPQFNYDDPFGSEWPKDEDTGMVILKPGQSVQWQVRLEIFPLT
jgi:aldose 1-epimerase